MTRDADGISLAAFLVEIRRRAPREASRVSEIELREPLDALITRIRSAPYTMEHRVLAQMLTRMGEDSGKTLIRVTEVVALSSAVLVLLSAFINDLMSGRYDQVTIRTALVGLEISTHPGTKTTLG